ADEVSAATEFGHVHGLGIDPLSGTVFAAAHNGVWKLPALGSAAVPESALVGPIAARAQDTMGFTIVGDRMLASGHPDPLEYPDLTPANLGLLESYDGAKTWDAISGWGETDFHDISAVQQESGALHVYGNHAGTVWFSLDGGQTWGVGAQLGLRDLVADPTEAGTVYATTETGLMISTDNGATFAALPDAPALYLVDAGANGDLVGVDISGAIWTHPAGGTWLSTGAVEGVVDALLYSSELQTLVAYDSRGIVVSNDLGAGWAILVSR
ncbi:MAG: sialidase family protein, partial [Rhodoglobus sp.]|nr:sialidase family protein [Rhodoglobus sp.]